MARHPIERATTAFPDILCSNGEPFTKEIIRVLNERKMTRRSLAESAGMSPSVITCILNGDNRPTFDTVKRIGKVLGIDVTGEKEDTSADGVNKQAMKSPKAEKDTQTMEPSAEQSENLCESVDGKAICDSLRTSILATGKTYANLSLDTSVPTSVLKDAAKEKRPVLPPLLDLAKLQTYFDKVFFKNDLLMPIANELNGKDDASFKDILTEALSMRDIDDREIAEELNIRAYVARQYIKGDSTPKIDRQYDILAIIDRAPALPSHKKKKSAPAKKNALSMAGSKPNASVENAGEEELVRAYIDALGLTSGFETQQAKVISFIRDKYLSAWVKQHVTAEMVAKAKQNLLDKNIKISWPTTDRAVQELLAESQAQNNEDTEGKQEEAATMPVAVTECKMEDTTTVSEDEESKKEIEIAQRRAALKKLAGLIRRGNEEREAYIIKKRPATFWEPTADSAAEPSAEQAAAIECCICERNWTNEEWLSDDSNTPRIDNGVLFRKDSKFGWSGMAISYCPVCGRDLSTPCAETTPVTNDSTSNDDVAAVLRAAYAAGVTEAMSRLPVDSAKELLDDAIALFKKAKK